MILYHATPVDGIKVLLCDKAFGQTLYFATKKEYCCAYLANPVQIFCEKNNIDFAKPCCKWAVNDRDKTTNIPILFEWWEGAFEELYKGVTSNYYVVDKTDDMVKVKGVYISKTNVPVKRVIKVPDIYKELLRLEKAGKIILRRFKDLTKEEKALIKSFVDKRKMYNSKELLAFVDAKLGFYI